MFRLFAILAGMLATAALAGCSNTPGSSGRQAPATPAPAAAAPATTPVFIGVVTTEADIDPTTVGSRIDFLYPDGPAQVAGLHEGDIITSVAGKPAHSSTDIIAALNDSGAGAVVPVTAIRNGKVLLVNVRPVVRPDDYQTRFNQAVAERVQAEEQAAAQAKSAHAYRAAFDQFVMALRLIDVAQRSIGDAPQRFDGDLAEVAALLPKLKPPPAVPSAAQTHSERAIAILKNAQSDNDNSRADQEFGYAIYQAPWVADLYLDYGLVAAKVGAAATASRNLNRYLILNPDARNAAAIRQKLAELAPLAAEQQPWMPFLGTRTTDRGSIQQLTLRGRTLVVVLVKPSPSADSIWQAGETLCSGTISGSRFQGQCVFANSDQKFLGCFGGKRLFPADGDIAGDTFTIQGVTNVQYHAEPCAIDSETRGTFLTYRATQN